jgi:hypothetical protein
MYCVPNWDLEQRSFLPGTDGQKAGQVYITGPAFFFSRVSMTLENRTKTGVRLTFSWNGVRMSLPVCQRQVLILVLGHE